VSVLNHAEKAPVHAHTINGPGRVKDMVSALWQIRNVGDSKIEVWKYAYVFRVNLSPHKELNIILYYKESAIASMEEQE
jgi:hypothetical protein